MKKFSIILMMLMISMGVFPLVAQEITPISYDSPVQGEITDNQTTVSYTFEGSAGDTLFITALGDTLTGELALITRLFSSSGALIGESTNLGIGARIGPLEIPADGSYTLAVSRESWNEATGGYSLLIQNITIEPISINQFVEGTLPYLGSAAVYTLDIEADTTLGFITQGYSLGYDLSLNNVPLIQNGYYDGPMNIINHITTGGTYQIVIQTLAGNGTDYSLFLPEIFPTELTVGTSVTATGSESFPAVFAVELAEGKMYQFNGEYSAGGDRYMGLFRLFEGESSAYSITFDYGSGSEGNPRIDPFIPEETGTYYIVMFYNDYEDVTDTDVEITLSVTPSTLNLLAPGTPLTGSITPETGNAVFAYQGTAGELLRITLEQTDGDGAPGMSMYSPDDEAFTFSGRSAFKTSVEVELPMDGLYRFVITNVSYDEVSSLDFRLLLEPLK